MGVRKRYENNCPLHDNKLHEQCYFRTPEIDRKKYLNIYEIFTIFKSNLQEVIEQKICKISIFVYQFFPSPWRFLHVCNTNKS